MPLRSCFTGTVISDAQRFHFTNGNPFVCVFPASDGHGLISFFLSFEPGRTEVACSPLVVFGDTSATVHRMNWYDTDEVNTPFLSHRAALRSRKLRGDITRLTTELCRDTNNGTAAPPLLTRVAHWCCTHVVSVVPVRRFGRKDTRFRY